jgi:hypothetical protein
MTRNQVMNFVNAKNLQMQLKDLPYMFVASRVTGTPTYSVEKLKWEDNRWSYVETIKSITVE